MKRLCVVICILASTAPAVLASTLSETEGGLRTPPGGKFNETVFEELDHLLMDQNNNPSPQPGDQSGPVDASDGLESSDFGRPIGYLIDGPDGSKMTYDLFADKPVLQTFSFDVGDDGGFMADFGAPEAADYRPPIAYNTAGLMANNPSAPPQQPPMPIPEPAAFLLLAAPLAYLLGRRSTRMQGELVPVSRAP